MLGEIGEGGRKAHTSSYKVRSGDVMYSRVTLFSNTIVYLKVAKGVNLQSSHYKKKKLWGDRC